MLISSALLHRPLAFAVLSLSAACWSMSAQAAADDSPAIAEQAPLSEYTADSGAALDPVRAAMETPYLALSLTVDPATETIEGAAHYTVRATAPLTKLGFDLDPRLQTHAISVNGQTLPRSSWANDDGRLSLMLPEPLAAGEETRLTITYGGKPRIAPKAPWDGGFVWDETEDGQPWIATAVQTNGCDLFWPCIDHPSKRVTTLDLSVTVPAPLVVAANGRLQSVQEADGWNTYRWRAHAPNGYGVSLQIGPYELAERTYHSRYGNDIPLKFWYLPGDREGAEKMLGEMTLFLDFFESTIGPYPWSAEKVGLAQTPHLGMEHQTINAYGNDFILSPEGYDWLMQHEFSHEWFANQLTNASTADMWLHEGFGTYMQPLFLRWAKGETAYRVELWKLRKKIISKVPLAPEKQISSELYNDDEAGWGADIYYKGAWILHTLREYVGDEAFLAATTQLTYGRADPRPGNFDWVLADTNDFQRVFENVTGKQLGWFVEAYFRHAELPRLVTQQNGTRLDLRWESGADMPFILPVEVQIGDRIEVVDMSGGTGHIDLPQPDTHFVIDPDTRILRYDADIAAWQAQEEAKDEAQQSDD
ncbi:M1 family metallopeptidase [Altericroceibacterium endophyticum]|uniref:Aminopeptidase N n=1 Tax=Altericroceibacterium endophyticum TaxID=1808508 RepID=A0A6I4T4Q2_9SPHN|nr:M1 family metallopeptidase [Altericroceibacterium endophyticum]MXO65678.1 M1 family peptidase [Altericroceibacterium endophyticum]